MRRELLVRCLATGTLRAEAPDGTWCEVRHVWLQIADSAACVRTTECCEHGRHRVERTIEFDQVSVRHRPGERALLDRLVSLAGSIAEGEFSVVPVWVSSSRPMALLHAIPVDVSGSAVTHRGADFATVYRARLGRSAQVEARVMPATRFPQLLPQAQSSRADKRLAPCEPSISSRGLDQPATAEPQQPARHWIQLRPGLGCRP